MKDLISVIVPVYNVEKYLDTCLKSIIEQSYKQIEVILVDDGSTDNSGLICDQWRAKDQRIKVIHKKNGGLSDARNHGLEVATGEYVVFVDSDDIINDLMIEYLHDLLVEFQADIGICNPVHLYPQMNIQYEIGCNKHVYSREDAICELLYQKSFLVSAWGKIYKRILFDGIRFPVGMLFEDSAIMYLLFEKAGRIAYGDAKLYGYMHRDGSITTNKFSKRDYDIIIICNQILNHYISQNNKKLIKAAESYLVVGALRIYMNAPKNPMFSEENYSSICIIKKYGLRVMIDKEVRRKTRLALAMFFTVRPLMPVVYRHVNRWK